MFECLFPGCGRKYASSDATRKHARKQHRGWLDSLPALQHAQSDPLGGATPQPLRVLGRA
jgi:hypothetical protein